MRATPVVAPAPRIAAAANTTREQEQAGAMSCPAAAPSGAVVRLSLRPDAVHGGPRPLGGGGGAWHGGGKEFEGAAAPEGPADVRAWLAQGKLDIYSDGLEELGWEIAWK